MVERIDRGGQRFGVLPDDQVHSCVRSGGFAQLVHGAEFPSRIDMQQREWRRCWIKRLLCQPQHNRRILAHRIQHDGPVGLPHHFSKDMDAFGFEPVEVSEAGHIKMGQFCSAGSQSVAATAQPHSGAI
jgi:hypothetical protein